ncbi:MAG: zinc-binding dehydrogenase [bacterium]|nr:zinc-binding dehydrogenase [bacterium]
MRAIAMREPGGPDVLHVVEAPLPQLRSAHDIRVRLHAAALNPVDYKIRSNGGYGSNPVLGCDGAGVVESVGEAVTRFAPGDAVYFMNGGYGTEQGTYAQFVVLDERYAAHKPSSLDFVQAAAVPLVLITAWEALYERADLREGDRVVVQAGAGGVGHIAVQLAALAGARVAATVSGPEKAALARGLGAEHTIDYRRDDVAASVASWSAGRGADVVFDTVGGATFDASLALLGYYGTLVTCVARAWPSGDPSQAMQRNLRVAFTWMPAPQVFGLHEERVRQTTILQRGAELFDAGKLRVVVGATYPLEEAAAAHEALQSGRVTGKVVLTVA